MKNVIPVSIDRRKYLETVFKKENYKNSDHADIIELQDINNSMFSIIETNFLKIKLSI